MGRNMMAKIKTPDDRSKKYYISDKQSTILKKKLKAGNVQWKGECDASI